MAGEARVQEAEGLGAALGLRGSASAILLRPPARGLSPSAPPGHHAQSQLLPRSSRAPPPHRALRPAGKNAEEGSRASGRGRPLGLHAPLPVPSPRPLSAESTLSPLRRASCSAGAAGAGRRWPRPRPPLLLPQPQTESWAGQGKQGR